MKHVFLLSSLLLAGGVISSCSSDELFSSRENVKRIEASLCDFVMEDGTTRTSYTLGANGYEAVWATGDVLGIYPLGGDQVAFPISDGVGTTLAKFDGGAWALRGTYQYAAYYPFSTDNYTISETAIPISYLGQTQTANNSVTHFADYDFMAAAATNPDASGSVTLPFKHLSSYLILPLTLPKAGTYIQLTLTSSNGEFITKGTVDLSAASPAITATETSSSISMNLDNIVLTADNLVLTANMLIAPVNLTGSTITITVTDSNGATYTNTEKAWTRSAAFLANTTYKASRTLAGSGTGGEIEGGGGLEEDDEAPNMHNGHEYVDLGLPSGLKWATCNIGATTPEGYGDYFAWGETEPYYTAGYAYDNPCSNWKTGKTGYNWESYKWGNGENTLLNKYNTIDNKTVLDPEDDAASQNWGGSWRMPNLTEFQELYNFCTLEEIILDSYNAIKATGPNGNWIIFPYAGWRGNRYLNYEYSSGGYWSSSVSYLKSYACFMSFDFPASDSSPNTEHLRCYGFSVRPVTE